MWWVYYALLAAFLAGFCDVTAKKITSSNKDAINCSLVTLLFVGLISLIILGCRFKINKFHPKEINNFKNIILYAILYVVIMILFWISINKGSNPAYTRLFYGTNILFTFFISFILLKATINLKILSGILITFIGLSIVVTSLKK